VLSTCWTFCFDTSQNISTSLAEMLPAFLHPGDECNIEK